MSMPASDGFPFGSVRQRGLTLLEVLVAMSIGAFMIAGILSLVVSVSATRTELDRTSEHIENGRYALHLFNEDVALAGYYGQALLGSRAWNTPDPCATAANNATFKDDLTFKWDTSGGTPVAQMPVPVFGYAAGQTLPTCLDNAVAGSEALVLHMVGTTPITPGALTTTDKPYVQYSACGSDPQPMQFDKQFDPVNDKLDLRQKDCSTYALIWPYQVKTYYLSSCSDCSGGGDGIPTLMVEELTGSSTTSTPLVEGVEDMHFEYGMDIEGDDGAPDCYVDDPKVDTLPAGCPAGAAWSATNVDNWANVVSVRVNLLVRSIEETPSWTDTRTYDLGRAARFDPVDDHFKRQVYSTVVVLPNVSGIRE